MSKLASKFMMMLKIVYTAALYIGTRRWWTYKPKGIWSLCTSIL